MSARKSPHWARLAAPVLFAGALSGCLPAAEGEPRPPVTPATAVPEGALAGPQALVGEYRVAGADGESINLPHGVAARIATDRIEVSAGCIGLAWSYAFEGGRLVTERVPATSCRRALMPQEQAIAEAFDAAQGVRRTPANGIEFSGGGRSVLLFSQ